MKRSVPRFAISLICLLAIPFVYNSCQGGLLGGKGFSSASNQCKARVENGIVTKLKINAAEAPGEFARKKVLLREDEPSAAQQKAGSPITIAQGTSLSIIINNSCLQTNLSSIPEYVIASAAIANGGFIPGLDRQAYEWVADRDYTDFEIEALADREPCVEGISWNRTYKLQATFNDASYSQQRHMSVIRAPEAYDIFYNSGGGMNLTGTLSNATIVAVIDSGVDYNHPDLRNNMFAHTNGIGIDVTTLNTANVNYYPTDASDIGHGTHVAGIVGAIGNNGVGIVGTMPYRARIMAIKVFKRESNGELSTTSQYFYNALKFAYSNGADVINLSLGAVGTGAGSDSVAQAAITEAVQNGSFVVVVMGNSSGGANGSLVDGVNYHSIPGQYSTMDGVIGVGSFDSSTGNKSFFSHYSTTYGEIAAPGAEQNSTGIYSTLPTSLGAYGRLSGTSQAAPIVAGAAALAIGLIKEATGIRPTPAEVERLIKASAIKSQALAPYFRDGNKLDLLSLAQKINLDYAATGINGGSSLINPCN